MQPKGKLLVVDDDKKLTFILRAHLISAGFDVATAYNGEEAVTEAMASVPDVIILDIGLPGMDGLEVTRTLRTRPETQNTPIILLTAKSTSDDVILGLDAGAQEYVLKPFDMAELTARVRSMFKLSQVQQELDRLNSRLTDEVRKKTSRLELLYGYVRELSRANGADRIYELIVNAVQASTTCRRVSIMIFDPGAGRLVCKRAIGIDPELAERLSVNTDSGIAGQVFTTGTTVVALALESGDSNDRRYASDAFLSMPLVSAYVVSGGRRFGVLNATDKEDGEPFTADEIDCLRSIADSAAIALHNEERRSSLTKSIRALLLTVGRLSEFRDEETGLHLERVQEYSQVLVRKLAENPKFEKIVTAAFVEDLSQAAPLHDIGKVGIPDEILNKPGKLSAEEYQIMKTHTTIGRHTLQRALEETGPVPLLQMCVDIAYCHHERFDGQGYPRGIAGEDIPLAARIIALVDAYDAMTSHRVYSTAIPHWEAVERVRSEAGSHFDPDIVAAFLEVLDDFDSVRSTKADQVVEQGAARMANDCS